MKKVLVGAFLLFPWAACQPPAPKQETKSSAAGSAASLELPYQATYTVDWVDDVSKYVTDQDLKMVLQSYKDWETGNMEGLFSACNDSLQITSSDGREVFDSKDKIKEVWKKNRDSLSQVTVKVQSWHRLYSPSTKDAYVATWFKEYDVYKDGHIDSAEYHDLNLIKNSKISWISTYRRPL